MSVQCLATNGASITTHSCAKGSHERRKGGNILRVKRTKIVSSGHYRSTDMIMNSQKLQCLHKPAKFLENKREGVHESPHLTEVLQTKLWGKEIYFYLRIWHSQVAYDPVNGLTLMCLWSAQAGLGVEKNEVTTLGRNRKLTVYL